MKILLVHNFYQQSGGEDIVFESEKELLHNYGHQVFTYTKTNKEIQLNSLNQKIKLGSQVIWASNYNKELLN